MKKPLIVIAFLSAGFFTAHAQSNKVVSAKMHLDEYIKDNDTTALKDAKDAIDLAAANDKTKDDPKMFLYRGNVYRTIYERQISKLTTANIKSMGGKMDKQTMMKATGMAYIATDTTSIAIAVFSYMRVIQLVPKDFYADEARQGLAACTAHIDNKATSDYAAGKFPASLAFFEKTLAISKFQGIADTSAGYKQNLQNTALVAEKAGSYPKAIYYYKEMIRLKVSGPQPYNALINIYNNTKDSVNSLATLKQARAAFPDDVNLLISETNVYLQAHDNDKAIGNLQTAINKLSADKDDSHKTLLSNLYFVLGNTYDRLANPKDDKNGDMPHPANYEDLYSKAEENYNKAIALTPDNFDELFDLGALYNNRAAAINKQANDVPPNDTKKYNDLVAKANEYSKKAQPVLEKAHQVKPDDQATKAALLKIYASTGQTDKIKELQGVK